MNSSSISGFHGLIHPNAPGNRRAVWRPLQQTQEATIYELLLAPLGWVSLYLVIHYPRQRAVVFAQPIRRDWGTSITNGAEWVAKAAYERLGPAHYYEWYYDKGSLDQVIYDPTTVRVSWRYFTIAKFESTHNVALPRLADLNEVQAAERDYTARYV